jgi:hypothetical protein
MVQVGAFIETMEAVEGLSVFSVDPQNVLTANSALE